MLAGEAFFVDDPAKACRPGVNMGYFQGPKTNLDPEGARDGDTVFGCILATSEEDQGSFSEPARRQPDRAISRFPHPVGYVLRMNSDPTGFFKSTEYRTALSTGCLRPKTFQVLHPRQSAEIASGFQSGFQWLCPPLVPTTA
jgi:hypothetical protein